MAGLDPSVIGNVQQPQQMSLRDMVNLARGTQAYQQAQQVNPLQVQQQQSATQSAQTAAQAAQLQLANQQNQIAGGAITGLENSPSYKKNDAKGIKKELEATEKWLKTVNPELLKEGGVVDQAHKLIDAEDIDGYKNHLATLRNALATNESKYSAALPSFGTNALGQQFMANRAAGTISAPQQQGQGNITPTSAGVENFSGYQKDLQARVNGATQNEMRLNEAEDLMKKVKTGAGTRAFTDVAQKLQAIGAPQLLVDKAAGGDLSAVQSLNKFIAQTVIQAATQNPGTAESINRYIRDNPDVTTDPRALDRFFEFTHKQNLVPIEEQRFLLDKVKSGQLNPDTHVAEAQQHILDKFAQKQNTVTSKESPAEKKIVKTGTLNGKKVVQYEDGSIGYK